MKHIYRVLMIILTLTACQQNNYETEAIKRAVTVQMETWPSSRLQDLYKSFFQDRFGPGHIIANRQSAKDYITSEWAEADTLMGPVAFPCGWEGNYVRVNLSVLANNQITIDELTDALMASAKPVEAADVEKWKEEWSNIFNIIVANYPNIPEIQEDKAKIDSLLAAGEYVYHHSQIYERTYHPHYRIIDQKVFENMLAPKLK